MRHGLDRVCCSASLLASARCCVAVDAYGNVVWSTEPASGPSAWHVENIDGRTYMLSIACPTETLCVAGDDRGRIFVTHEPAEGAKSWTHSATLKTEGAADHIISMSCPSTAICYGLDEVDYFGFTESTVITADPSAGGWRRLVSVPQPAFGLSCPTTELCVGVSRIGEVFSSTDPSSLSSWHDIWVTADPERFGSYYPLGGGVACAPDGFCIFGGEWFDAWMSSEPTTSSWIHNEGIDFTTNLVTAFSCSSASECVGVDASGGILLSTTPTGRWSEGLIDPQRTIDAVSCATADHCVAFNVQGGVVTSNNVTAKAPTWIGRNVSSAPDRYSVALSCVANELCADITEAGYIVTVESPESGEWKGAAVDGDQALAGISCPSTTLCVAVDRTGSPGAATGNTFTTTEPTGVASAWHKMEADSSHGFRGISCPSTTLCVAVDEGGNVLTSTEPAAAKWSAPEHIDSTGGLTAISCPSTMLCVAVDAQGNVLSTTNPTAGASAWSAPEGIAGGAWLTAVSCGSSTLCVALDARGKVLASSNPTGGTSGWSAPSAVDIDGGVSSVSCATGGGCVAVDRDGNIVYGTPTS